MNTGDTIAAISTPIGDGGIGIVRLSGPEAIALADRIFVAKNGRRLSACRTHTIHYGHIVASVIPSGNRQPTTDSTCIDEVLVTVMRAPQTYTREDVVEINCHGGIQAVKKTLDCLLGHGCRLAEPGEFTKRAFLNGRIDLARAEAVADVIAARTETAHAAALDQLEGALSREITAIRTILIDVAAHLEAAIDFPDEDEAIAASERLREKVASAIDRLRTLGATCREGMILKEGVRAVICGKPNVGKSSLMNLLLKRDRVIVSPVPGTTRDTVEETISLRGIPIRLTDTAGIAVTKDRLERAGIARTEKTLRSADIVIFMVDAVAGIGREDRRIAALIKGKKTVAVINKTDRVSKAALAKAHAFFAGQTAVAVAVRTKRNIVALEEAIVRTVWGGDFRRGDGALVTTTRHKELLDKALKSMLSVQKSFIEGLAPELVAVDLKEAIHQTGLIVGESVTDDVLDRIFERFCIGK